MPSLQDWPEKERPREKLLYHGPAALSNAELLAIFLRTGVKGKTSVDLARDLLGVFGSLRKLFNANAEEFCETRGLGMGKYVQLQAVLEMSKRYLFEAMQEGDVLSSVQYTKQFLVAKLGERQQEIFSCLFLNARHQVIGYKELFNGSVNRAEVYPREVVKAALAHNAVAVIFAHNHPSGSSKPSRADQQLTQLLQNTLKLVDIHVLDHIVVAGDKAISFVELGMM